MEQTAGVNTLSARYLCKRCHLLAGIIDNLVNCTSAKGVVEPIKKKSVSRFEDCPHRKQPFVSGQLDTPKLKALAAFARDKSHSSEEVAQFEASLRNGSQMTG